MCHKTSDFDGSIFLKPSLHKENVGFSKYFPFNFINNFYVLNSDKLNSARKHLAVKALIFAQLHSFNKL